jgi:regulator of protease activity HflC (stomatin/prohibitin superfamily)
VERLVKQGEDVTTTEFLQSLALVLAAALLIALSFLRLTLRRVVIFEHERGLRYQDGRFREVLAPGRYWFLSGRTTVRRLDVRPRFVTIPGQELLSSDGVSLKISLAVGYEVVDPALAVNGAVDFNGALYSEMQLVAREVVGSVDIDGLLSSRAQLSERLAELGRPRAEALGLRLTEAGIKDIMFPGHLKEIFAQVVAARQEGLAALERARGESAALRNLANAARMIDDNPNLMQLRVLQALGESSGNTVVMGLPAPSGALPVAPAGRAAPRKSRDRAGS